MEDKTEVARRVNLGCLPVGQQPNKRGYAPPRDSGESRLTAMMREYARERWVSKADFVRFYGRE